MGAADQGQLGRYQLVRKLATGGMAEVFLAKAVGPGGFEKTLVVKRILPGLAEDPSFVEMFLSEARLAAQLNHPNIAQIFDFGDVAGTWFLAMEYIDGPNVRTVLRASPGRRMPLALGAWLLARACEGLAYAHEFVDPATGAPLGLIHRDVSPDNLLVSSAGAVKVVDFGIAKAEGQVSKTETGVVKGKVAYMAPEQLGGVVDLRADVYSVGVILYELAAGVRPYGDLTGVPLMAAVLQSAPPPLRERAPDVPADYAAIVAKAMARSPAERFQSCRDLEAALSDFVQARRERVGAVQLAHHVAEVMGAPAARATGVGVAAAPGLGTPVSNSLRAATDLAQLEAPPPPAAGPTAGRELAKTSQLPPVRAPEGPSPLSPEVERARQGQGLNRLSNTSLSALSRLTPEPLPNPLAWDSMLPEVEPPAQAAAAARPSSPDAELRASRLVAEGEALRAYEPRGPIADLPTLEAMRAAYEIDEALLVAARFASHAARLLPVHQHAPGVVAERLSGAVEALLMAEAYGPLAALLAHLEATSSDASGQWVWTVVRATLVTPGQLERMLQRLREGAPADPEAVGRCLACFGPEVVPALLGALEQPELAQAREALLHGLAALAAKAPAPLLARLAEPQPRQLADFVWVLEKGRAPERQRAFRQLLARREPATLREVLTGLARAATSEALQVLSQALGDRLEEVRACAIDLLGQHFPDRAFSLVEPLSDATQGDELSVAERDAVWRAIGRSTQPEAFQRLEDTLRRKPSLLNRARLEALKLAALGGLALVKTTRGEALLREIALAEEQPEAVRELAARLLSARAPTNGAVTMSPLRIAGRRWKRTELTPRAFLIDLSALTLAARIADMSAPQFDVAFHRLKLRLDGVLAQQQQVVVGAAGGVLVFNGLEQEPAGELALIQLATGFARYGVAGFSLATPVPLTELRELVRWLAEGPVAAGVRTPSIQRQRAGNAIELPAPPTTPPPSLADPTREATTRFAGLVLALRDFLEARRRAPTTPPPDLRATLDELAALMQTRAVRFLGVAPRVTGTESVAWHHVNVTMLALGFGAELGLPLPRLQALAERAFLHDVGMYGVPEEVLLRTGRLSPADNEALLAARRRSAWFPFERLGPAQRAAAWASTAVEFGLDWGEVDEAGRARQVHEIGLVGGIISLAKTYDALTSRRGYREAMTPAEALGAMQSRTYQRFRPDLLPLFITFLQRVTPKPPPAAGR